MLRMPPTAINGGWASFKRVSTRSRPPARKAGVDNSFLSCLLSRWSEYSPAGTTAMDWESSHSTCCNDLFFPPCYLPQKIRDDVRNLHVLPRLSARETTRC